MTGARLLSALCAFACVGVLAVPAFGHAPESSDLVDDGTVNSGKETHGHDAHEQHGGTDGHIEVDNYNVDLIGFADLFADGEQPGRIADVSAKGNFAYLTSFYEPECGRGGIHIVDIADPANPKKAAYIPGHTDTFSGEGSQVVTLDTPQYKGDLLVYQNEICPGTEQGVGGVSLVDVRNPRSPKKLVEGFGDFTNKGKSQRHANEVHSAFAWQRGGKAYVVMTDDEEATDVDIIDITNPSRPKWVADHDLSDESAQAPGAVNGDAVFLHDMVVKRIGGDDIMLLSYWDGGYIKLNVNDPANPIYLGDTEYATFDPFQPAFTPEGNGHQAEFTKDNDYFIATDEDFDPYRGTATITDGPYVGTKFTAIQGSDVPQINSDNSLTGDTRFVGLACDPGAIPAVDAGHPVAVIERGVCDFTVKVQNVEAAGYDGAIVFNRTGEDGCETLVSMLVEANIPALFVSRTDGFRILGQSLDGYTCSDGADASGTAAPATGIDGSAVDVRAEFDGWGYVHLYENTPSLGTTSVDQYAIPESQDPAFAEGHGDLSVHEIATDPDDTLAYVSYYAGGFRVLDYSSGQLEEKGAYIANAGDTNKSGTQTVTQDGNNFWGVEVHKHPNGQKYALASDRDSGVWIFQYTGP